MRNSCSRLARATLAPLRKLFFAASVLCGGIACRFIGYPAEAEDIAQIAFFKLLEAAPGYRPTAGFRIYLYRIVIRLCIDYTRKKRPILSEDIAEQADRSINPAANFIVKERASEIRKNRTEIPSFPKK